MFFLFLSHSCPGVKNADEAELRQVASEPLELNVYNVNDFPLLSKLVGRLARILCGKIEDRIKAKSRSITHTFVFIILILQISSMSLNETSCIFCKKEWSDPLRTQFCPIPAHLICSM